MGVKDTANLAMIPAAYAEDKVYSVVPSDGDGDFTFTRSGSGTRINKGGYIETMAENVPRLNYRLDADGNPKGCPELLLEESRTNLFTNSNSFTSGNWFKSGATVLANQTISPTGENNASLLTATVDNGLLAEFNEWTSTQRTASFFAKKNASSIVEIYNASSPGNFVRYDLENGAILSNGGAMTGEMQNYGNGWYRLIATHSIASGTNTFGFRITNAGTIYIFGAQIEEASTVSSYIPTEASAITRNVDSSYNQPFGDLASDYPITVYWKGRITNYNGFNSAFSIYKNGSSGEFLIVSFNTSSQILVRRAISGSEDIDYISHTTQIGDVKKIAIKFISATTLKLYIDGIEIFNESSGTSKPWDFNSVLIGQLRVSADIGKRNPADELFVWNKALTDAEMVDVTSYNTFAEMATGQQFTIQ
jgi:hypothetical protein